MFRVIIAGGRDFKDYDLLVKTMNHLLSNIKDDITVVCGKARGADTLGEQYAKEYGYSNTEMAKNADALVAFWDGMSLGTRHMIEIARSRGLKVRVKRYDKESVVSW